MKEGDKVTIRDYSYARKVVAGELKSISSYDRKNGEKYTIIEVNCKFPIVDRYQGYVGTPSFNNTVIQAIDSGKVVFIEERFLDPVAPKHKVMIDMQCHGCGITGKVIEISDKLYKEIKRSS